MKHNLIFLKIEDNPNFFENGRQQAVLDNIGSCFSVCNLILTQLDEIWKMTSIFFKMEDNLIFWKIENDLNCLENGRQPQLFWNLKTTSNFNENEKQPHFFLNGRWSQFFWKWKTTSIHLKMEDNLKFFFNGWMKCNLKR